MAQLNLSLTRTESRDAKAQIRAGFISLLDHLYRGGTYGYMWARSEGSQVFGGTTAWWVIDSDPIPGSEIYRGNEHIYFGVHPCAEIPKTNKAGEPRSMEHVRGRLEYIAAVNCVFADIDQKDFSSPAAFKQYIKTLQPEPSVIVFTGNGIHAYWLLDEPFPVYGNEAALVRAQQLQYAWIDYTKSDQGAKDLARVLRVPGSLNWKSDPPERTRFLKQNMSLTYTIDELEAYLPQSTHSLPQVPGYQIADLANELEKAKTALSLLKPWRADDREEWVKIGMALSQLGDVGFELWDEWSQQSLKYNADDAEHKWKSWRSADDLTTRQGITLRSLYATAKEDAAQVTEDDEAAIKSLIDRATDSTLSWGQQSMAKKIVAEKLTWYPDDVVALAREYAKSKKWPKTDFDRALSDAGQSSSAAAKDDNNDDVNSLLLAHHWLKRYPHTAWVEVEWYRFSEGIWVPHPVWRIHREMTELALDIGIKPEKHVIVNAVFFAQAFTELQWGPTDWDPDPTLIVVENGVLDISDWPYQLLEWSPEYRNLVKMPVRYEPGARCPTYKRVLLQNLAVDGSKVEAKSVARYLMQFAGMALAEIAGEYDTGIWLFGPGGGGKSTILVGLAAVFGHYSATINVSMLDKSQFGLEPILHKKLVYANESDTKFLQNPGHINDIVSNDWVSVNPKFKPAFQYKSRAAVLFAMNELPGAANPDSGIYRRIKIVEVPPRAETDRDPALRKIIENDESERSGILNLILQGLREVQTTGFPSVPASVEERSDAWQVEHDKVKRFVRDRCTIGPQLVVSSRKLYTEFEAYCKRRGIRSYAKDRFDSQLKRLGFKKSKSSVKIWRGLDIDDKPDTDVFDEDDDDEPFHIELER